MIRLLLLCTFCLTLFQQLGATNKYWNGNYSPYWDEPNNWSPAGVPTSADDVFLFCDCSVIISGSYDAVAASVTINVEASLSVQGSSSLTVTPTVYDGIMISGRLNNWGAVSVRNPNTSVNLGIRIDHEARVLNWGTLDVSYARTAILVTGQLNSWGDISINEAAANHQDHGLYVNPSGYVLLFSDCEVSINHTNIAGLRMQHDAVVLNYGDVSLETNCIGRGVVNSGDFSNDGRLLVRGATTDGFFNAGELDNSGLIRFYSTASGNALSSNGGNVTNRVDATIKVFGSQFDEGIRFVGTNKTFNNRGLVDIYTGQHSNSSLYFHWGTELINQTEGEIKVRTYAQDGLTFNGDALRNLDGFIELECYGPNKNSLRLGNGSQLSNEGCGTIQLNDHLRLEANAELNNYAWLEIMNETPPSFYAGSQINNAGVIYDRSGALENVDFSHIYNDEGVIVTAPTEAIIFGDPYTDYILAGPHTNVEINNEISDGSELIGDYDESGAAVYFDENAYNHPKYFYAEFNIPGCSNRTYRVYNNTPAPSKSPVFGGGSNWEFIGQRAGGQTADLKSSSVEVFPNPVGQVLNLQLSNELQGQLQLELRDLHGRSVLTSRQAAVPQLSLDRPANLPGGTYLLTVTDTGGEVVTKRVVFQ